MTEGFVISTVNLSKNYGKVEALKSLSLDVPYGAIGLLGPNGAGKSTLLKLLLGLTNSTGGSAELLGADISKNGERVRERVGYMPETDCLPSATTAADFVGHMAEMSGLPSKAAKQRANDVLYQVGMDEERYRLIKGFSTGMKQRVKLAQAIVHDPSVVFLDEPTAGLDPQGRDEMLALIQRIHRQLGISVVVSSHILEDIERVCDFVVILDHGQLVLSQSLGSQKEQEAAMSVQIDGNGEQFVAALRTRGVASRLTLSNDPRHRSTIVVDVVNDAAYDAIRDVAADLVVPLRSMSHRSRSLEDLYLTHINGQAGSAEVSSDQP